MSASPFTGTFELLRFLLRHDRVRLPAWIVGVFVFVLYLTVGIPAAYGTDEELATATVLFADPVGRLLTGPGYGFDDPTVEAFIANGYGLYLMLVVALMSILLVVRHTRAEEQTGRAELVIAGVVHRRARITATLVLATIANGAAGLAVFVAMIAAGGHTAGGSLLLGASVGAVGLAFVGVTVVTAQLTTTGRAAAGMAGVVLGAAFLLRAVGDIARPGGSWPSWLSPLGQAQQTAPFVLDRWWPLVPVIAIGALTTAVGVVLSERRDLGAGLLAERVGRAVGSERLGTPIGLEARLQRSALIAWAAALVVAGALFGAFADSLLGAVDELPEAFRDLFGADDMLAGYLAYMAMFMGFLVAAYAVLTVQARRGEELAGRLDPVLATGVGRVRWMLAGVAVTTTAVVGLMVVTGVATGVGTALVTGDPTWIPQLAIAHLVHVPAVLVVLGLATALYGLAPSLVPLTWAVIGYGVAVGSFGALLDLPDMAFHLSPFSHPPQLPLDDVGGGGAAVMVALLSIAVGLITAGVLGVRHRDVRNG